MAEWKSFKVEVPGKDVLEDVRDALETIVTLLEVLKALLETVKALLTDFGNPVRALIEALIKIILTLFETLKRTGIYAYYDVPELSIDPNFERFRGGYQSFNTRFKGSLGDVRDPNRPQPISGATRSGFVMVVVDATTLQELLRLIAILMRFFGNLNFSPQYGAPANLKVLPIGDKGDPILAVARAFDTTTSVLGLAVEWSLPANTHVNDPGFQGVVSALVEEFVPPSFLIERSVDVSPTTQEIDISVLDTAPAVGVVTYTEDAGFINRSTTVRVKRKRKLLDEYGDPVIKFEKQYLVNTSQGTGTFILGQLGKFRFIDTDVEANRVYYYRVRAYSGTLPYDETAKKVRFDVPSADTNKEIIFKWPGTAIMGKASGVIQARMLPLIPKFDVIEALRRVFQLAFALNFHVPLPKDAQFNDDGTPANENTSRADVGKGSLTGYTGIVGDLFSPGTFEPSEVTGIPPEQPWQSRSVRRQSARLANIVASALLEQGSGPISNFQALMLEFYPRGTPDTTDAPSLRGTTNIRDMVYALTYVDDAGRTNLDTVVSYDSAYTDVTARLNLLEVINFIKSITLGGVPPDWIQVSLLRDIVPWAGQFLYDLIAKIQALLDAYSGVIQEIKDFIDLLERKINVLEDFIKYLISILDFITSLEVGAYVLSVPSTGGDTAEWGRLIDNASGQKPPSGPGGYTAGVCFAYIATDVTAFATAFKLLFGG